MKQTSGTDRTLPNTNNMLTETAISDANIRFGFHMQATETEGAYDRSEGLPFRGYGAMGGILPKGRRQFKPYCRACRPTAGPKNRPIVVSLFELIWTSKIAHKLPRNEFNQLSTNRTLFVKVLAPRPGSTAQNEPRWPPKPVQDI